VDHAVNAAVFGAFMNSGQICMSGDRILVHESIAEDFAAKFTAKVAGLAAGDPADPGTIIGPLIGEDAARRVAALVQDAVAKGANVLTGGGEPVGAVHPATVLSGVTSDADLHHDEAFGPVCVIATFADDGEAVALAGDTDHGLTCGILTENGTHDLAVCQPDPYRHRAHQRPVGRRRTPSPLRRHESQRLRPALGHRGIHHHPLGHPRHRTRPLPALMSLSPGSWSVSAL
jgi:hypothetical protein